MYGGEKGQKYFYESIMKTSSNKYIMKSFLKNLGLLLILIGTAILVVCSYTGNVNSNGILLLSIILVIGGLISYIVTNKRIY
jgi:hypothetical protein